MTHNHRFRPRPASPLPIDIWVPDHGWVAHSCLTHSLLDRSVRHADLHGDAEEPVSRWQGGLIGAVSAGLAALVDFPPGPLDRDLRVWRVLAHTFEEGLVAPTHDFRSGQRVFRRTDAG